MKFRKPTCRIGSINGERSMLNIVLNVFEPTKEYQVLPEGTVGFLSIIFGASSVEILGIVE